MCRFFCIIQELEELLKDAVLIEEENDRRSKTTVTVGDTIELTNEQGQDTTYTIVGSNESDPTNGKISNESPVGQAILGRSIGENITVSTPTGKLVLTVKKIQ